MVRPSWRAWRIATSADCSCWQSVLWAATHSARSASTSRTHSAIASASPDGKAGIVVGVTDDLTAKYSAVDFVRVASVALGGKGGGGRPDMAQGGGPDGSKAADAIAAVKAVIAG